MSRTSVIHGTRLDERCPFCFNKNSWPGVGSDSCPFSQWCHPTISSSVSLFSFCLDLFQCVSSSYQVAKVLELQLQHQSFQWVFRVDSLKDWLVWCPCCPRDSQESSPDHSLKWFYLLIIIFVNGWKIKRESEVAHFCPTLRPHKL